MRLVREHINEEEFKYFKGPSKEKIEYLQFLKNN
jgi:hypothetical protein